MAGHVPGRVEIPGRVEVPGRVAGRVMLGPPADGKGKPGRAEGSEGLNADGRFIGGRAAAGRLTLGRLMLGRFGDGRTLGRVPPLGRPPPRFGMLGRAAGRLDPPPSWLIPPLLKPLPASAFEASTTKPIVTARAVLFICLLTIALPK